MVDLMIQFELQEGMDGPISVLVKPDNLISSGSH